jgi:uncharacterized protein involved in tolerance to divalent cations
MPSVTSVVVKMAGPEVEDFTVKVTSPRPEEGPEAAMICKTRTELVPLVIARVKELHSYEVPCITSWEIATGSASYLDWVGKETG